MKLNTLLTSLTSSVICANIDGANQKYLSSNRCDSELADLYTNSDLPREAIINHLLTLNCYEVAKEYTKSSDNAKFLDIFPDCDDYKLKISKF
jgi:hypothetical protein